MFFILSENVVYTKMPKTIEWLLDLNRKQGQKELLMIDIRFVNFDRSEALETYVRKHLGSLLKRFEKSDSGPHTFEVHFKLDAKAPLGQIKNSEVMLSYRYPGLSKPMHIHKKGADLRKAFMQAVHALKDAVQKNTVKKKRRSKLHSKRG